MPSSVSSGMGTMFVKRKMKQRFGDSLEDVESGRRRDPPVYLWRKVPILQRPMSRLRVCCITGRRYRLLFGVLLLIVTVYILASQRSNVKERSTSVAWAQSNETISFMRVEMMYRQRYKRDPPPNFVKWYEFASSRGCILDDYDLIETQLAPFRKAGGITNEMIEKGSKVWQVFPVYIKNGTVQFSAAFLNRRQAWFRLLLLPYAHHLPDMTTLWNMLDEPRVLYPRAMPQDKPLSTYQNLVGSKYKITDAALVRDVCDHIPHVKRSLNTHSFFSNYSNINVIVDLVPIFSYGHIPDCFADLIVPSGFAVVESKLPNPSPSPQWSAKQETLFWRGSTTSALLTTRDPEVWPEINHRIRFVSSFANDTSKFNVSFTKAIQCRPQQVCESVKSRFNMSRPVSHSDHWAYKYLWDMDGNGSSGRFIHFLKYSKSLIFRAKLFSEWFDGYIRAGKHYLSFNFDYSDTNPSAKGNSEILRAIEWAKKNDREAERMVNEVTNFANKHLRLEDMQCYSFRYLLEYHSLLRDQ